MIAFILRRADFKTALQAAVVDYDLVLGSTGDDTGTINLLGKIGTEYVDSWLVLEKNIWIISKIEPAEKESKLTLAPALEAFSRPILLGASAASAGAFLEAALTANFKAISDDAYKMAYLNITNNADSVSYTPPKTDDSGFYGLNEYIRSLEAEAGLEAVFTVQTGALGIEFKAREESENTIFFHTQEAQLLSQTFANKAVAKVTVVKGEASTDFYLSASGEITTTPPTERATGSWEVVTAKGADDVPLEVARSIFLKNIEAHKIEFMSARKFKPYDRIRTNLNGVPLVTNVCFVGKSKRDSRYRYKCGELRTTLTEKISGLKTSGGGGLNIASLKQEFLDAAHPVGSLYWSSSPSDPSTLFGGVWERIKDRFILAAGDTYPAGTTGGSATHTHATQGVALTVAHMPERVWTTDRTPGSTGGIEEYFDAGATYGICAFDSGKNTPHDHGDTTDGSSMPPYITAYVWKRIA